MSALRALLCSVLLFALAGCGYVGYNDKDRLASISPYEEMGISVLAAQMKINGQTRRLSRRLSPKMFFITHSGLIIGDDNVQSKLTVTSTKIENSDFQLKLNFGEGDMPLEDSLEKAAYFGGAAPVSNDGYFITANHVVDNISNWMIYLSDENGNPSVKYAKIRIVYADDQVDFAIVKADFPTKNFLQIRNHPLRTDEVLFTGNWVFPSLTAGKFVSITNNFGKPNKSEFRFSEIRVTTPIQHGDSGTPLIDSQGNLCGIMTRGIFHQWLKKKKPEAYAVMIDMDTLFKTIQEDRKSNQGLQETSLSRGS